MYVGTWHLYAPLPGRKLSIYLCGGYINSLYSLFMFPYTYSLSSTVFPSPLTSSSPMKQFRGLHHYGQKAALRYQKLQQPFDFCSYHYHILRPYEASGRESEIPREKKQIQDHTDKTPLHEGVYHSLGE